MILGFKDQFVRYIEDGSKTHTIRAGDRWKVGMRADLFEKPRQKGMRLLFRAPVVRVQEIEIRAVTVPDDIEMLEVRIDGSLLDPAETEALFHRDGFRKPDTVPAVNLAYGFWLGRLPFHGQIIHWDYAARSCPECGAPPLLANFGVEAQWPTQWPTGEKTAIINCCRCGLTRPCQYIVDPLEAFFGYSDLQEWWCRPCYLERKSEYGG